MKRYGNLDMLRVIASIMVIFIHVSGPYVLLDIKSNYRDFLYGNFYDSISRFGVPIFVMLSGAFLLNEKMNGKFSKFLQQTNKKIIGPTIRWSIFYIVFTYSIMFIRSFFLGKQVSNYIYPLIAWINGKPYYHLWYMYMIIGLYLFTPLLVHIKTRFSTRKFLILSIFMLLVGFITSFYGWFIWPLQFFQFVGYFMIGNVLRVESDIKKRNIYPFIVITLVCVFSIFCITFYTRESHLWFLDSLYFYHYLSPFVILGSLSIFQVFLNIRTDSSIIQNLAKHTTNIYFLHAGVLTAISILNDNILGVNMSASLFIPCITIVVFLISLILSVILRKFFYLFPIKMSNILD